MPRYTALLRGINLGAKRRIAMADLRTVVSKLGFADVSTLMQSGNVLFTADSSPEELAVRIEAAIEKGLGLDVRCMIRSGPELNAIVGANPLADVASDGARMLAVFLSSAPHPDVLAAHDPVALDPERVRLGERVIYQWCPDGILEAPAVGAFADKHLGVWSTARNWNTVTKLAAKLDA